MSNKMKGKNIITVLSAAVIVGFILGLVPSFNHIVSNRYIRYKAVRLIALSFQQSLHRWLILTIIVTLAFIIMWLLWKIFLSSIFKVYIREKNVQRIILACIVCSVFLFFGGWAVNYYWLPGKFHLVSLLADAGILLFAIFLGWMLIKVKEEALFRLPKTKGIRRTSVVLVLALMILNLFIFIDSKINYPKAPNIVLIGVDTLRADHLKCYGYGRETSPEIDALAKEGVLFLECISHIPTTTPSFASILTSKRPISHGVLGNNFKGYRLDNWHMTLAELLKNRGYNTAAFVSGWTLKRNANLTQGFDVYDDAFKGERQAELVNREVFRWLEKHRNGKFFLFVHYFDPHSKYDPPPPYNSCFAYTTKPHDISKIDRHLRHGNISDPSFYIAKYDGEIKYTDYHIGQLLKKISELDPERKTLIVFTADHGETLVERQVWFNHGHFVYDEQIHVPLLLWYPGIFGHKKIDALVRLIDVLPTILDVLGINFSEHLEGRSLLPLIKGDTGGSDFVYCETTDGYPKQIKGRIKGVNGKQFAIRSKEWKLIRTPKTTGIYYELYNLDHDPEELHNLIGENLAIENQLRAKLFQFVRKYRTSPYYLKKVGEPSQKEMDVDKKRWKKH